MLIVLLIIFMILSFAMSIWALVIIFKRSVVGGLLTLFLGLPMLYYLVIGWGKEEGDIRKPFFLSIIFYLVAIGAGVKYISSAAGEMQQQLEMQAPSARSASRVRGPALTPTESAPRIRDTAPPAEIVKVRDTPAAQPVTPAAQPVAAPRAPAPRPVAAREEPRRPQASQSGCVYKPVMTDEDMAKCR
jgi:hypothetical protein